LRKSVLTAIRNVSGCDREHEAEFVKKVRKAAESRPDEQSKTQK
jgi:hypothetical protein